MKSLGAVFLFKEGLIYLLIYINHISNYSLVICEKPSSAKRIAQALRSDNKTKRVITPSNGKEEAQSPGNSKFFATNNSVPTSSIFETVVGKKGKTYVICYALGHLYRLEDANSKDRSSPIFNPVWKPLSSQRTTDTKSKFLKFKVGQILKELEYISKNATEFVHACDFDQEGEVIGHNILEFACKNKYAISKRAKFSSLTDEEILTSFNNLLPPKYKLKDSGISRHMIDYYYGINLSRALTKAVSESFPSKNDWHNSQMSIGRVQGPTLAFVVERENEILKHIPVPYWNIKADFIRIKDDQNNIINTIYFPERIDSKGLASAIVKDCKGQSGTVTQKKNVQTTLSPPNPFNLGDLQREAFKQFGFIPSLTLSIAEKLYLSALISYPRTSSKKLPPTIEYANIISKLSKYEINLPHKKSSALEHNPPLRYLEISKGLLAKSALQPNEGKDEDPAHPSIYPTGEKPKKDLGELEKKLLDLIIRRFFSTFGENASISRSFVTITVKDKHLFKTDEKKITFDGWTSYYNPYFNYLDYVTRERLSQIKENDILTNVDIEVIEKTTQPPPRYNQSTLLQMMERENIGTKATRSEIINILLKRNYIYNFSSRNSDKNISIQEQQQQQQRNEYSLQKGISEKNTVDDIRGHFETFQKSGLRPTEKGIALINSMKKYAPDIISTSLTRALEQQLSGIELGTSTPESVLKEGKTRVTKILQSIDSNKARIGQAIRGSLSDSSKHSGGVKKANMELGQCPLCKKGQLIIKKSIKLKKRFVGCTNYSVGKCTATAPLPSTGTIRKTNALCTTCNWPIVSATGLNQEKKYQWRFCINKNCPLKI